MKLLDIDLQSATVN